MRIFILILLFPFFSLCQNINVTGSLKSSSNSEPVPFANLIISNSVDSITTISDIDGRFTFRNIPPNKYHLYSSYVGGIPIDTIILLKEDSINLILTMEFPNEIIDVIEIPQFNKQGALNDIENNNIIILLPGGLIGSSITEKDNLFELNYKIKFLSQGCVRFEGENEVEYNQTIFNFLDKKYGLKWRKEIRTDAIGLK